MRITKIIVKKLFDVFDHEIPLKMDDRITIIHGKNGIVKTNVLRLIDGFFNRKYSEIYAIPFKEFLIYFDDDSYLSVEKKQDNNIIKFSAFNNKRVSPDQSFDYKLGTVEIGKAEISNTILSQIEDVIPDLTKLEATKWFYFPTNEVLDLNNLIERFSDLFPLSREFKHQEPEWLSNIRKSIQVRFIESQRLLNIDNKIYLTVMRRTKSNRLPSVITYSRELSEMIQTKLADYGELSQSLDRTFPLRVVQQSSSISLTDEQLQQKLNELEGKRKSLINTGLLKKDEDINFQVPDQIDETTKRLLALYVNDVEQKLNIFNDLSPKLELFQQIINEKFFYKKLSISQEKGFIFTTDNNQSLSPTDLSSGEQHELVMLYELLFKVAPNSLILIDEPELSLHVAWKIQFLKDLEKITQLANIDIIISTHSPTLINDRWDLTVELKGSHEPA